MTQVRVGGGSGVSRQGTSRPIGTYAGTFDPSAGLPASGTGLNGAILKGDYWKATGAGTIASLSPFETFAAGDLIYALVNNADVVSEFLGNKGTGGSGGDFQDKATVVSSNTTAANDGVYHVVASATFTDPSPTEGKGYTVIVRNGTATVGGTGYAVAGIQIRRIYHSGAWANYFLQVDGSYQPIDSDLTAIAALSPSNDDIIQRKAGAWTNRTIAQLLTDLGLGSLYQPLDSDLTAIAALSTTAYGRALLTLADAAAADWKEEATTASALVDGATIDLTATHHTLSTSSSRTFTISYTGDSIKMAITLTATSATFTLPSGHKGIYNGTPSGTNTLVVTGAVSGDVILVAIEKVGTVYYWVGRNAIR